LTLIAGPEVYTEAYALGGSEVTIGRETGDIVFRDDGFVSGTHARVAQRDGGAVLEDLNSSNGTFIRTRDDYRLEDDERVLMGQQLFRLEVH
jgi:pSer/pThr/pTyr-binding forkhead associated (FHA) protein